LPFNKLKEYNNEIFFKEIISLRFNRRIIKKGIAGKKLNEKFLLARILDRTTK
jgi:hypothetical protein